MRSFNPITKKIVVARGARIDSSKLSVFFDQVTEDLIGLGSLVTETSTKQEALATIQKLSDNDLRQRVLQLAGELEELRRSSADQGDRVVYRMTLYDSSNLSFVSGSSFSNRLLVNTTFGEATVPINAVQPRFFQESVNTSSLIPIEDLNVVVTGTFDANDDQGVTNHESGGTVDAGEPLLAFNGNNNTRWIRKVTFPLYDDTTEVMCELTVDLPAGSGGESNAISIITSPIGDVDVLGVYTSPDLSNSFTILNGFTAEDAVGTRRWIFPVKQVQRVKIRLRQRNWVEEDGRKVFYYGAEEIGMQLMEWDKTYSVTNTVAQNHSLVLSEDAPDGYVFTRLLNLTSDPMYTLEDLSTRHIHIKVCSDADGDSVLWDSDSDALPQNLEGGFSLGGEFASLYFVVTMNYVATSGGSTSPFPVGTSPVLRSISFHATVQEE